MAERDRYLVAYDIADPKRLRRVAKVCEGYGFRIQFSVFECPLDGLMVQKLLGDLQEQMNLDEDQVLLIRLGPEGSDPNIEISAIGRPYVVQSRVTVI